MGVVSKKKKEKKELYLVETVVLLFCFVTSIMLYLILNFNFLFAKTPLVVLK